MTRIIALTVMAGLGTGCDDDGRTAEQGDTTFRLRVENVSSARFSYLQSGRFDTAVGADLPGPIGPNQAYEVSFVAGRGARLSFATMFVESNDFFYAPSSRGIALYDERGAPISGDVTSQLMLWDAGTELDQEPGLGPDQAPRQSGANVGARDPIPLVKVAADTYGNLPDVSDVIRATLTAGADQRFVLRIENVSTATTLLTSDGASRAVPLSPGTWVLHERDNPLFRSSLPAPRGGLEAIAEDGNPAELTATLALQSGITVPLSGGVWIVHRDPAPLFEIGVLDEGRGLEQLAEDGDPALLASALATDSPGRAGAFTTPLGGTSGPIRPGGVFELELTARDGDRLSLATMYVQSNDLVLAPAPEGIALFEGGAAVLGDISDRFALWDVGTEVNQAPGIGNDQPLRQFAPGTGASEQVGVQQVTERGDGYTYAEPTALLRVTLDVPALR